MSPADDLVLIAAFCMMALAVAAQLGSVRATVASALAGALSAGVAAGLGAPARRESLALMAALFLGLGVWFWRRLRDAGRPRAVVLAEARLRLGPHDVALGGPLDRPGTCWQCGAPGAPPRTILLERAAPSLLTLLLQTVAVERVALSAPLCPEHGPDPARWSRIVARVGPLAAGGAVFVAGLVALTSSGHLGAALLVPVAGGVVAGAVVAAWVGGRQAYSLCRADPLTGLVVVRFQDPARAERVRSEVEGTDRGVDGPGNPA